MTVSHVTPHGFRVSWEVKQHLQQEELAPSSGHFQQFHIVVTDSGWLLEPREFSVPGNQTHLEVTGLITGIGYEVRLTGVSESGLLSRPLTTVAVTGTRGPLASANPRFFMWLHCLWVQLCDLVLKFRHLPNLARLQIKQIFDRKHRNILMNDGMWLMPCLDGEASVDRHTRVNRLILFQNQLSSLSFSPFLGRSFVAGTRLQLFLLLPPEMWKTTCLSLYLICD